MHAHATWLLSQTWQCSITDSSTLLHSHDSTGTPQLRAPLPPPTGPLAVLNTIALGTISRLTNALSLAANATYCHSHAYTFDTVLIPDK